MSKNDWLKWGARAYLIGLALACFYAGATLFMSAVVLLDNAALEYAFKMFWAYLLGTALVVDMLILLTVKGKRRWLFFALPILVWIGALLFLVPAGWSMSWGIQHNPLSAENSTLIALMPLMCIMFVPLYNAIMRILDRLFPPKEQVAQAET